ncbi:MAG: hypothetical protein WC538_22155 [Thermoanaerobaculia bacterium]|jgi:hypothetical protein
MRDLSTVVLIPTRGMVPIEVACAWVGLGMPQNQGCRGFLPEKGREVGAAYETLFGSVIIRDESILRYGEQYVDQFLGAKWIVTLEEDNIPGPKAIVDLLAAIHTCVDCGEEVGRAEDGSEKDEWTCASGHRGLDGVAALYYMKTDPPIPMAFGDPATPGDFRPLSVAGAIEAEQLLECNGIPMGCAIFRKAAVAQVSRPWFKTEGTQDIYFCRKAKEEIGSRFAVATWVRCAHMDAATGRIW